MTHEELLAKTDWEAIIYLRNKKEMLPINKLIANTKSLRAVVELHKPVHEKHHETTDAGCIGGGAIFTYSCGNCRDCRQPYPCPTIQAIQEQLK